MPYKDIKKRKEYGRAWAKKRRQRDREMAFQLVGDKCIRCGHYDKRVLEFDHIIPILRKTNGLDSGWDLARQIATGKISPKLLQTLCANCHTIKTYYPDEF